MTKQPNMHEKLAAAYLALLEWSDHEFRPVLDRMACKSMTAKEICALFEIDHYPISRFMGGTNHPTNLVPMLVADHRQKTYKKDALDHARVRRAEKKRVAAVVKAAKEAEDYRRKLLNQECVLAEPHGDCGDPDCKTCFAVVPKGTVKAQLTDRQKAYRKAVYAARKAKRGKPRGWGKKK